METIALSTPRLRAFLESLGRTRRLIGPVRREGRLFFELVARASELDLVGAQPVYSVKSHLFPPRETLLTYERDGRRFVAHSHVDATPTALIGVRPCDLHAIHLLDHVFDVDRADPHYAARRRAVLLVGLDCASPCGDHAFCADLATNVAPSTFDLMLYPLHDGAIIRSARSGTSSTQSAQEAGPCEQWIVRVGTQEGRIALEQDDLTPADGAVEGELLSHYQRLKRAAFPHRLNVPAERLPGILQERFNSPRWRDTASRCYSCGSCNLVCPTCYCFHIDDSVALDGASGSRVREWDGCQLRGFAQVAGGHDFRPDPAQRLRHRVMRKGKWIQDRTGLAGCVGCGRCDLACTAKISIRELFNELAGEVDHVAG